MVDEQGSRGCPLVVARDVSVVVDGLTLLRPTTLTVRPGDAMRLVGPNGAGKTTLLRVLTGLATRTGGQLDWPGGRPGRRDVSTLLGAPTLFQDMTVLDHFRLLGASWDDARVDARLGALQERFRIAEILRRFPAELSSGERQMVGLVSALARPGAFVVLDEPEQRLDVERRRVLCSVLDDTAADGRAVLVATHDPLLIDTGRGRTVDLV
ncbi:hypothetical protein ASF23_14285 [Curtobacterium sp. Leaf261]|nr:hypothetical protein ASF23_14285 [Curtobacterium sp. Leaf261]